MLETYGKEIFFLFSLIVIWWKSVCFIFDFDDDNNAALLIRLEGKTAEDGKWCV